MMVKVRSNDGEFLAEKISEYMNQVNGDVLSQICVEIFSYYELNGNRYLVETEDDVEISSLTVGSLIFSTIASNVYRYILPFIDKNGTLFNGVNRTVNENASGNNNSTINGTSGSDDMNEDSPINADLQTINTPTFKRKSASTFNNSNTGNFNQTMGRDYSSPEYIREFEKIKTYFTDAIRAETERFIYEYRLVY